ncbi:WD repeat-containing protein 27 isoform X2 [Xenopus tropicalis]|uniref:WD repeat domain 27 n=1 Tax=Xenopus tropicalis TaxID=8364 RepID=A0A803J841_XENTR|nr:WD repeat-containing protein 27 isoform X2 [Xenopus tropicalis]|eukprot:XP_017949681.1 PREDICTED: WD repeat-containing protein 27 isoform X2 [Xenopus tropicalis]
MTEALHNIPCPVVIGERRSTVSSSPVSHVQISCTSQYCAFPLNGNNLCIWNISNPTEQPIILKGHHQPITAVTLSYVMNPWLVCSASPDYVILWNIKECKSSLLKGCVPQGHVIATLPGRVVDLEFHPDLKKVAACAGNKILILSAECEDVLAELAGHLGPVNAAKFCDWQDNLLVSISEDRTFKVWDYHAESLVFQSAVLSAFPLLKMYIDAEKQQLVTGCADGQLRVFSLLEDHHFRSVCQIDLQKEKLKFLQQFPESGQLEKSGLATSEIKNVLWRNSGKDKDTSMMDSSFPVLYIDKSKQFLMDEISLFGHPRLLWVASSTGFLLINMDNCEVEAILNFNEFDALTLMRSQHQGIQTCRPVINLSIVSSEPLLLTSPLRLEASIKSKSLKKSGVKNTLKDQPLVFHKKVKSSGYSAAPRMKMFSPKTNIKKTIEPSKVKNNPSGIMKEYPLKSSCPNIPWKQISVANKPTAVSCIQYSGNGKKLACGLFDKSILLFSSDFSGEPSVFAGHDGTVNGLGWSQDSNWLISSAEDSMLKIWSVKNADPVLVMGKGMFSKPVRFPQFYYMDNFILLSSGAEFHLLKYSLDEVKDDLKRYKQKSWCKSVQKFQMDTAVEITGLSAVNDFYSYLVLAVGSNRTLEIFDLNLNRSVAVIRDVHPRAAHQICQNKGSAFTTQASEAYNLFVTTAIGDGLKLWDMRTLRCVRRFEGHINRSQPCGIAISPCGRFIACGSEDRSAYLYDIHSSTYLQKLSGHTETVINVAFNPSSPQLTTATLDGKLQIFVS